MLRICHRLSKYHHSIILCFATAISCRVFELESNETIMSFPHLVLSAVILWPSSNLSRLGLWPPCPHQDLRSKASVVQDGDLWRFQATPTHLSIHWSTVNGETRWTVMWWEKHEPQNFQLFQVSTVSKSRQYRHWKSCLLPATVSKASPLEGSLSPQAFVKSFEVTESLGRKRSDRKPLRSQWHYVDVLWCCFFVCHWCLDQWVVWMKEPRLT